MSFCAVDDKTEKQLMVIWDLGRRCTFACSYCPPHRKNNWSETASFDELKATADALHRYSEIYNKHRDKPFRVSASFTGGEPTVNPAFFKFLEYLQESYPGWKRTLTTNGFYTKRKLEIVMANTDYTTVSYHCEATPQQKKQVRENLNTMLEAGYGYKINVMFHERQDLFDECIELCHWADEHGVPYTPRVIGDQSDVKLGIKDKTVHEYTPDQMAWMKHYWRLKKANNNKPAVNATLAMSQPQLLTESVESKPKKIVGQSIGRPCCGGRKMDIYDEDGAIEQKTFVDSNNFQGWNCMINWYFLYIHQEINQIWHHQTCQVNLDGKVGPICKADEFDQYCDTLEDKFNKDSFPYITCPKTHCGCGLCVPKAKHPQLATKLFASHTNDVVPRIKDRETDIQSSGTLKHMVYAFDADNGNETI